MFDPKPAGERDTKGSFFKLLVYGPSGSGKTTFGARFMSKPLILLTEPNGMISIQTANPKATVQAVSGVDDLRDALSWLRQHLRDGDCPYDAVVLDSMTDLQAKMIEETKKSVSRDILNMQDWQIVIDKSSGIAKMLRDLPCHSLMLIMAEEIMDEKEGRLVRPTVAGKKLPGQLLGFFSYAVYSFIQRDKDGKAFHHRLLTRSGSQFLTKSAPNWPDVMAPDAAEMWRLVCAPLKEGALDFTGGFDEPKTGEKPEEKKPSTKGKAA